MSRRIPSSLILFAVLITVTVSAQERDERPPVPKGKVGAPTDLTGQWVSVVTEDWRFRMVAAVLGDVTSVPLTPAGRKLADQWDPKKDEAAGILCKAYGAPGIMRMPGRIRISWTADDTLRIDTDAGTQTRMLYFGEPKSKGNDWQGISRASWMTGVAFGPIPGGGPGGEERPPRVLGTLIVTTTRMRAGYVRRNGVPYSDNAVLTEYFDRIAEPNGDVYLNVTAVVTDPIYFNQPFITSSHFKKQSDESGWNPTPCSAR